MNPLRKHSGMVIMRAGLIWLILMVTSTTHASMAPDYGLFDELLLLNVRNGFVDYAGFRADPRFAVFLDQIAATDPANVKSKNERLAFYINAYNALAIQSILDGYSPSNWWGRRKYFRGVKHPVLGEKITLEDLEHKRILSEGDPRVHFAIVCASLSCPKLSNRAYLPGRIDYQLHDAARAFINDPLRNRFDYSRRTASVSMIFKWFSNDFETAGGSVQRYMARFIDDARSSDSLREDAFKLNYNDYNWNLNGHLGTKRR
jgi:hypothetical protein